MKPGIFYIILFLLLLRDNDSWAQSRSIDSLKGLLKESLSDTARARIHLLLTRKLLGYDIPQAAKQLDAAAALMRPGENDYNHALYYLRKGELLFERGKYDEGDLVLDSSVILYDALISATSDAVKRTVFVLDKGDCFIMKGLMAAKKYNYHASTEYFLEGVNSLENIPASGKMNHLATLYADIASNYFELEQFDESLKYDKLVLNYIDSSINVDLYVIGHLFVADDFARLSQFDSAAWYLGRVSGIADRLRKPSVDVRYFQSLGGIYRHQQKWEPALTSFSRAYAAADKMEDAFQAVSSLEGIAASYLQLGQLTKARDSANSLLSKALKLKVPLARVQALELLSKIEERLGNIGSAYGYQLQFIAASDSLKKEKLQRQMHETEERYQSVKKEKEILQLQTANAMSSLKLQRRSTFNYILIGSIVALLVTGFLGYRNLRHRQAIARQQGELQQQRIRELEKDKQLVAVDSMLKGQEEERSRLAKDLHDGLGGLLSGVKFSLNNMKDNLIMTPDNMVMFERSLDMLDTSIKELRRVAHNMMPEMLNRFGLDEALKEYCNTVNSTQLLTATYQSLGMEPRLDNATEIIVYRVVQELLNNILKHAQATTAFIQVIRENNRLNIVVEDNGKGFDPAVLEKSGGAGWTNIRSRVEYLRGQIDVHSAPGKGTLVNMEFNLSI